MTKSSSAIKLPKDYVATFRRNLLHWFRHHRRDLPWRIEPRDPYHVWIAEVMLQQTQVSTVIPYYERWLQRFPTLQSVAIATQDQVLKQWQGLGYYTRARNVHKAMQQVWQKSGGVVPSDVHELMKLPGIGRYTAGAISSLAFERQAPILDGNVARVFSRVFAIATDIKSSNTLKQLWMLSETLLPRQHAGQFNEALMDLGALICTPKVADCPSCPLSTFCTAYAKEIPLRFPKKTKAKAIPTKHLATIVLFRPRQKLLIAQRSRHGLLGGLWEFPSFVLETGHSRDLHALASTLEHDCEAQLGLQISISATHFIGVQKHAFTHFRTIRHIALTRSHTVHLPKLSQDTYIAYRWATVDELVDLTLARDDIRILNQVLPLIGTHSTRAAH
jgi:A/G-specific adenine glycosylase